MILPLSSQAMQVYSYKSVRFEIIFSKILKILKTNKTTGQVSM